MKLPVEVGQAADGSGNWLLCDADDFTVAIVGPVRQHAGRMAKIVNAHDALVQVALATMRAFDAWLAKESDDASSETARLACATLFEARDLARAALALARGEREDEREG